MSAHGWNHQQCYPCWFKEWKLEREPTRFVNGDDLYCCFCGRPTSSGIYRRARPGSGVIPHCTDVQIDRSIFNGAGSSGEPPAQPTCLEASQYEPSPRAAQSSAPR